MKIDNLDTMVKGWFVGNFTPTVHQTEDVEVAIKDYQKGDTEIAHQHRVAVEITVIILGEATMRGVLVSAGSIITISPGETCDFTALTDVKTVVVKMPSVIGDKYKEITAHD